MLTFPEFRRDVAPKELLTRLQAKQHYKEYVMEYNNLSPKLTVSDFQKAAKALNEAKVPEPYYYTIPQLGICTTASASIPTKLANGNVEYIWPEEKQGNNPMRAYSDTTSTAAATIINAQSDESKQREYLLEELSNLLRYSYRDPIYKMLREMFNLDAPLYPKTSQELIDAFKNGKFTVDQKMVDKNTKHFDNLKRDHEDDEDDYYGQAERFYGITFTDLPVADRAGYEAAEKAYEKAQKDTKRKIIVGSPAEGLEALLALESWKPETVTLH